MTTVFEPNLTPPGLPSHRRLASQSCRRDGMRKQVIAFAECGGPSSDGNDTDFNIGGLKLARTRKTKLKGAIRVLEHAVRVVRRATSTSTSTTTKTGRLVDTLEGYVRRLKRLEEQGRTEEFFRVLQNAQMTLVKIVCTLLR